MAPVPEEKEPQKKKIQIKVGNENVAIVCNPGQLNNGTLSTEQIAALHRAIAMAKQRRSAGPTVTPVQASNEEVKPVPVKKKVAPAVSNPPVAHPEESPQEEIREFIVKYTDKKSGKGRKELSVKDLRHIIPLLIMHTYSVKEEPAQKKVKGIWNEKPKGWPEHLPYCDPNNAVKDGNGKPKKEILMQMCDFLVEQFTEKNGREIHCKDSGGDCEMAMSVDVAPPPQQQHHVAQVHSQPSPDKNSITKQVEQVNLSAPIEVSEDDMSDPAAEILERNKKKLVYLKSKAYLNEADSGLLSIIADLLNKMYLVRTKGEEFFLQTSHDLELTFDLTIRQKRLPDRYRQKWKEFEEHVPSFNKQIDDVLKEQELETAVMEENEMDDLDVVNEEEVETTYIDLQRDVVQLMTDNQISVDFENLGIQQITLSDVNELQEKGLLDVRIVNTDEDTTPEDKDMTEEEKTAEKMKLLLSEKSFESLSPQKADVSTVIEVPYGQQNDNNKATRPPTANRFGQQQMHPQENQQLRALLTEPSLMSAQVRQSAPEMKFEASLGESSGLTGNVDDEMRKMVMALSEEGLLNGIQVETPMSKTNMEDKMGELGIEYMENTGGQEIEMDVDDLLVYMEPDKPAPVPITVSEIADTGPPAKRQSGRGKSRLKRPMKTKY